MPDTKKAKSAVKYGKGTMTEHCGACTHFQKPHACTEVKGYISETGWCELFKRKPARKS